MTRLFIFFIFLFCSSFSHSLVSQSYFLAEDDSFFDDSELADIEGLDSKDPLEEEFDTFSTDEEDNFDKKEFEEFEEEDNTENSDIADTEEEFDRENYEVISDKPDYELVTDEEIEREFGDDTATEEDLEEKAAEGDLEEDLEEEAAEGDLEEDLEEEAAEGDLEEDLEEEAAEGDLEEDLEDETAEGDLEEDLEEKAVEGDLEEDLEEEAAEGDLEEDLEGEESEGDSEEDLEEEAAEGDLEEDLEEEAAEEDLEEIEDTSDESLNLISNIRYISEKDQIVIDCSEATTYSVKKNTETNQYILEIFQSKLADNLNWPYVLRDFKTSFGLLKADQKDSNTVRVIIQLKEGVDFPQSSLSEDSNQIFIGYGTIVGHEIVKESDSGNKELKSILPSKTLEDLYLGDIQFSGEPLSFHVKDAPIKEVLRFISEESGLNMVVGESVTGTVTLKLEDVPWDQALYTIFKVKSLGYTRDGNVITILPLEEIEQRTKKLKEISDRQKSLTPYITKVIPINYGKMSDIAEKLKGFSTKGSEGIKSGQIIVHTESNTFVVIDTEEAIKKMEAIISYLDRPPKQVMIEAKIVEAQENFTKKFGLNWNLTGNLPVRLNVAGFLDFFKGISGSYRFPSDGKTTLNLNNLPVVGNLQASLDLAESNNYAQVISTPKVVVISGKPASINRNAPILIDKSTTVTTTAQGGTSENTSKETMDVSISLKVTPTVTTTGSVFLQVDVTRSDPGAGTTSGEAGGALTISKTAKTEVLVKNGETIVIGGLYEKNEVHGIDSIPIVKNIPFLNLLFNRKARTSGKSELLVFITPRLLDEP